MPDLIFDPISQATFLLFMRIVVRLVAVRRSDLHRLVVNFIFFVLLTLVLVAHGHVPFASEARSSDMVQVVLLDSTKAVWWISGASVVVSGIRLFLIVEGNPREGRLLQDLIVAVVYVGSGLSIGAYVLGIPVGTLIATSGAFAIILGLALQSTLNDVFSGIALKLGRPYAIGDWLVLDSADQGKVIETNWRSTILLNATNDLVVIPNSALAKAHFLNLSRPSPGHGRKIKIKVALDHSPAVIQKVLKTALSSSNSIARNPEPMSCITSLDAFAVEVELTFFVANLAAGDAAQSEVYDLIYRHLRASGLSLASSADETTPRQERNEVEARHPGSAWRLLNAINLFEALTEDEKETLAASMKRSTFRQNTTIVQKGTIMSSLYIVRSGVVEVVSEEKTGGPYNIKLSPGDFIGEEGVLMGSPERSTLRASSFVVVYEIPKDRLAEVLRDRPAIADELGEVLAKRKLEPKRSFHSTSVAGPAEALSRKIRMLLHINPASTD